VSIISYSVYVVISIGILIYKSEIDIIRKT